MWSSWIRKSGTGNRKTQGWSEEFWRQWTGHSGCTGHSACTGHSTGHSGYTGHSGWRKYASSWSYMTCLRRSVNVSWTMSFRHGFGSSSTTSATSRAGTSDAPCKWYASQLQCLVFVYNLSQRFNYTSRADHKIFVADSPDLSCLPVKILIYSKLPEELVILRGMYAWLCRFVMGHHQRSRHAEGKHFY